MAPGLGSGAGVEESAVLTVCLGPLSLVGTGGPSTQAVFACSFCEFSGNLNREPKFQMWHFQASLFACMFISEVSCTSPQVKLSLG